MADSLDDLERAVEELIAHQPFWPELGAAASARAAQARELVRRLRAGVAECERVLQPLRMLEYRAEPAHVAYHLASDILAKLTGAAGEERRRGTT